ncbi:DUF262 domain-containing protein [Actinacidiphila sp. bgisy144]|uniref:DUF262 domain-containing protein n=1 Tax=Actinacidiphila sp. bgisy144 TaxID=3413791 RepID=UPI003EBBA04F
MTTETPQQAPDVVEDVFEGTATGVEVEQDGDQESGISIAKPWDPSQIRVTTNQFSLRNILDQIDEESIELAPDFQRGKVWKTEQKSRLIESLLLNIPLPAFYFAEDSSGGFRVVDGLQRLSTLHDFVRGNPSSFTLRGLEYLEAENGKSFTDLPVQWQRRINNAQLTVNVIDPTTPSGVMYDIFKRINTGGTPLNAQEIRHCMSRNRSRQILKTMTAMPEFDAATHLAGHIRMNDREVALRFAAFWLRGVEEYGLHPAMDAFLETTTALLDAPGHVPDTKVEEMYAAFRTAMRNARLVFGEHAFRKWPLGQTSRSPINRALVETWSIALARYSSDDLERRRETIVASARQRMTDDFDYLDAITSSTGDRRRVTFRFEAAAKDAAAGL